jgi:hypothetical protein
MERRLRSHGRASIVQFLGQRALTGRMPAMETHLHADYVVVVLDRPHPNGCCAYCIVRHPVDTETYVQLRGSMQRFYKCCYCTVSHLSFNNARIHTSGEGPTLPPKNDRYSLASQLVRDESVITCHCPEVASQEYHRGELITLCCLKHKKFQNVLPTFWRVSERSKHEILIWLKDFAEEWGNTSDT